MTNISASRRIARRTILRAGAAAGVLQVTSPFILTALGDTPVKIGMVNPLTGVLSALAQSEVDGAKYAEAELNKKGGILGRPVELLIEDSANDVGTGVQKTRKLIDRDQVDVILGDVNSGIAAAMGQVTNEKKVFHIAGRAYRHDHRHGLPLECVPRVQRHDDGYLGDHARAGEALRQEMVLRLARLRLRPLDAGRLHQSP